MAQLFVPLQRYNVLHQGWTKSVTDKLQAGRRGEQNKRQGEVSSSELAGFCFVGVKV